MAHYYQPASLFCSLLPPDVILNIAYELATLDLIGPPAHLPPLLRVCKYITHILTSHRKALLARIFRSKFDTRAAQRRLGPRALTNSALAFQLVKQTLALKRLRRADLDSENLLSDLWTVYIMFVENDGRNYPHLLEYTHLDVLVDQYMDSRLYAHSGAGWPLDITPNALVVWLLWFTMTPERLQEMIPDRRGRFMNLLRPFAIASLQYTPFFAPDNHFDFPINESLRDNSQFAEGTAFAYFPMYREPLMVKERVIHFGQEIAMMSPLLGLGAKMAFLMLAEAVPYEAPSVLPIDRAHADPSDGVRPTQADFVEWASVRGVQFYQPGEWDWLERLSDEQRQLEDGPSWRRELRSVSSKYETDWNRLRSCIDPYRDLPLRGVVYTFGSMVGMFAGRMQIPDFFQYREMVHGTSMPAAGAFPPLAEVPVYVRFREHHCIDPATPVPMGGSQHGFDDGVLNAYLPKSFDYTHVGNTLRISVPDAHKKILWYEEYVEGRPSSHTPTTCGMCCRRTMLDQIQLRERIDARVRAAGMEPSSDTVGMDEDAVEDGDDEDAMDIEHAPRERRASTSSQDSDVSYFYGDENDPDSVLHTRQMMLERDPTVEALVDEYMSDASSDRFYDTRPECDGVQDIIITGETLPRHGEAWHHFRFYGRVRQWDGLIVLVRIPTHFPAVGKTIFRGYVVGNKNFVGSWRSFAENIQAIPLEGPFAMSRIDDSPYSAAGPSTTGRPTSPAHSPAPVESDSA